MILENKSENYACTVVEIKETFPLPNSDNLAGVNFFGSLAIVSKDTKPGLYLLFPAESKISSQFLSANNQYRDTTKNIDRTKSGFFEDNGRVKALKLRGNISTAFVCPVEYLEPIIGDDYLKLKAGDSFTHINGSEICRKYVIKEFTPRKGGKVQNMERTIRIEEKFFPQHLDTSHWLRNEHEVRDDDTIIVTEKIHSTSGRFTHQKVRALRKGFAGYLERIGLLKPKYEYQLLAGSRKVVKFQDQETVGYYQSDVWNLMLERIKDKIPKNYVIYGEITGWDGEKPLQRNYTYQMPMGTIDFYIYRVAVINEDGLSVDLGWEQLKQFCSERGLKFVPEIGIMKKSQFNHEVFEDKKLREDLGLQQCLPLDSGAPCSEGVCIRVEGLTPKIYKYKSPAFLLHESKQLDTGEVDIETQESE